jgi:hypothetical protein
MPALRSKPTICPAEPILFATSRVTTPVPIGNLIRLAREAESRNASVL